MKAAREDDYPNTGYGSIDEEHRTISKLIHNVVDALNTGSASEVGYALDAVSDTVTAHFRHEERLMAAALYAKLSRHKAAHDTFLSDVKKFRGALAAHGITPDFRRWCLGRLGEWFRYHVIANDLELARYLLEHANSAAAAPHP